MKKLISLLAFGMIAGCSAVKLPSKVEDCFLLYNVKTGQYEKTVGGARCEERFPPCSTFKVPLAVMSFDAGILRDENTSFLWDGVYRSLPNWNRDHTAFSWMQNSVVWYSQEVTKIMGPKKLKNYLEKFNYGNKDSSGSLTKSWLTPREREQGTIRISAFEQVDFMKKLWTNTLPASQKSIETTKKITFLENSKNGFILSGKTGSGMIGENMDRRLGWFVAHLEGNGKEYIAVYTFNDKKPSKKDAPFAGPEAKEKLKSLLAKEDLWQ